MPTSIRSLGYHGLVRGMAASSLLLVLALPVACSSYEAGPNEASRDPSPDAQPDAATTFALSVIGGTLEPAFSSDHFDYTVRVPWTVLGNRLQFLAQWADATQTASLRRGVGDSTLDMIQGTPSAFLDLATGQSEQLSVRTTDAAGRTHVYVFSVRAEWPRMQRLKASPSRADARLGQLNAVATDPAWRYLAIGAQNDNPIPLGENVAGAGACTVFERIDESWEQIARFEGEGGSRTGVSVALGHEWLAVGAPGRAASTGEAMVKLYRRSGSTFTSDLPAVELEGRASDSFGTAVTLIGDQTLVVGAPTAARAGGPSEADAGPPPALERVGRVHVFQRTGETAWSAPHEVLAPETRANMRFGSVVVAGGDHVAVSALTDDHGAGDALQGAGTVYVYPTQEIGKAEPSPQRLRAPLPTREANFGTSLAMHREWLLIGAKGADARAGRAYMFRREASGRYVFAQELTAPRRPGDDFGIAVALGEGIAYVAAPNEDGSTRSSLLGQDANATNSGVVYSFEQMPNGAWELRGYIKPATSTAGLLFGVGVQALGGELVTAGWAESSDVVGTPNAAPNSGAIFVLK